MLGTETMFPKNNGNDVINGIIDAHLILYGKRCPALTQDMINNN